MPPLKFLSDEDLKAMHEATLQVLQEAGVFWTHKPSLEILQDAGCTVKDNRVYFPPDLVMDSIAKSGKRPACISIILAAHATYSTPEQARAALPPIRM